MTLQVKVRIEPRAAILARKAVAGVLPVDINDEHLTSLAEDELLELAGIVEKGEPLESKLASEPSFEVVRSIIKERLVAKAATTEAVRAADEARRNAEARAAEEEAMRKRMNVTRDAEYKKAIGAWLEEHSDEELKERFAAGFASDEEIIDEALHQIFEIEEDEHVPIRKEQACDCEKGCTHLVRFLVAPIAPGITPLDARQFSTLERIKEAAPDGATVEGRVHKASCPNCKCTPLARLTARVSLEWNGYLLVKEYALG